MKKTFGTILAVAALGTGLVFNARAEDSQPGSFDFGKITPVEGSQFVEVNIQSNLIAMVVNLASKSEPQIAEALKGLKQVRVNVVGLTEQNRLEMKKKVADLRAKLDSSGWDRVVTAMQDNQDVGVFIKMKDAEAVEGVVVTVLNDENQAVLVNVIGNIQPAKLAMVGERFDIEPLKKIGGKAETN